VSFINRLVNEWRRIEVIELEFQKSDGTFLLDGVPLRTINPSLILSPIFSAIFPDNDLS